LIGSVTLINAAVNYGVNCFVFASSIAVYGSAQTPMSECVVPQPEDPYGIAKLAVEQDLDAAHRQFGLNYIIFRPHNVYGERQNIGDPYRNVVGIFMNRLLRGEPMPIFGDGEQARAFTYVADVAPIIASAPEVDGARNTVFNVGSDTPLTVNRLARIVAEAMGREPRVEYLPARQEVKVAFSDHSRLKQAFGLVTETPIEEGIRRMAAWVVQHGARRTRAFEGIEIRQNLPPSWAMLVGPP
jgi:UDP-glucose 4-epimerase